MKSIKPGNNFTQDSWDFLKKFTAGRIALGSAGVSIPTSHVLEMRLAHAQARDSVYSEILTEPIQNSLRSLSLQFHLVQSSAINRDLYLKNPDAGRTLRYESKVYLESLTIEPNHICFILGDGLSAKAINSHAVPLLGNILPLTKGLKIAPIIVAKQARVALGDEIGFIMKSEISVMLIGERPGLSSPDSLGIYITYNPKPGLTDEKRNCISNIHTTGISYHEAADTLMYLISKMLARKISGVELKDDRVTNNYRINSV